MNSTTQAALNRLASLETSWRQSEFLAPVLCHRPVRVRMGGAVLSLAIVRPRRFQGWGVFQPLDYKAARWVRQPTLAETSRYLQLFPRVHVVLCRKDDDVWLGLPLSGGNGALPIQLAENVQVFDAVRARYDGACLWYEGPATRHSPRQAANLREQLEARTPLADLALPGLTQAEQDAYALVLAETAAADVEARRDRTEERLREAVERAGGRFRSYLERGDGYLVELEVTDRRGRSQRYRPAIGKELLQVQSAGICLAGTDAVFDLTSLVDVYRQGQEQGRIHRTDGLPYDDEDDDD